MRPVLNYDTLFLIMSFLSPGDVLSLMRTCHTLYEVGMPLHLGTMVPPATWPESMSSLCDFLLARPTRLRLLKGLRLNLNIFRDTDSPTDSDRELTAKLVQVLNQTSQLRDLDFSDAEYILTLDKSLGSAISSLQNLTRLFISEIGPLTRDVLRAMRSPVSSFSGDFQGVHDWRHDDIVDPVDFLESFKDTLAAVDVSYVRFHRKDIRFPNVHTVRLALSYNFDAMILSSCFPNICNLQLRGPCSFSAEHTENLRRRSLSIPQETWTSLDILESNIDYAYTLGLRFRRHVRTWHGPCLSVPGYQIRRFRTLLNDLKPLRLSARVSFVRSNLDVSDLRDLFPARSSITHLKLYMHLTYTHVDMAPVTEALLIWVSKCKLEFLEVHIEHGTQAWLANYPGIPMPMDMGFELTPSRPIEIPLATWDLEGYVQQLALISPGLRHVFVRFQGVQRSPSFWKITREDSEIHLHPLLERRALRIVEDVDFDF